MPNILLGVTGGIAAYKAAETASLFSKTGHSVKTVMTPAALKFITSLTFETLTKNRVYTDLFDKPYDENHTSLSGWADIAVIVPATASTISRFAYGMADNLLSAVILDFTGPVLIAPAMHSNMYSNPATEANLTLLRERGFYFVGPADGALAGGKTGLGRLENPEKIVAAAERILLEFRPPSS